MVRRWLERLVGMTDRRLSAQAKAGLQEHRPAILTVAAESGISPALLAGIIAAESDGDADATSHVELPESLHARGRTRAQGLMQVVPTNLESYGVPVALWRDPLANIRAGARVLLEEPAPYGRATLDRTLKRYRFGGLDRDASDYIADVETLAARSWAQLDFPARTPS